YLETPKSRAVVNAKIPRNMHWHIVSNIDLPDAAIAFGLREFKCKISAGDDARKAALVFLIVERVAGYFAIERHIFAPAFLKRVLRDRTRRLRCEHFGKPFWIGARLIEHSPEMIV